MKYKGRLSISSGVIATVIMTVFMLLAPLMGMPKMNPAEMLAGMMGVPVIAGWLMHFMIGITFAAGYIFMFYPLVKISNKILKGALFGIAVFIFAQIALFGMSLVFGEIPPPEGSMALMMVGSVLGHVVYGIVVAFIAKD
ncbi:MAG: DUF6789 family protein [Chitinophagales bacterium]|nr:DUF6789 family protein [Chitinophagales bacterium]